MNTQAIEELLGPPFSIRSVSYQMKAGDQFFSELLVLFEDAYIAVRLCSNEWLICQIWGFHGGDYDDYHLLGDDAVWFL
jgi:hypothetical protein